MIKKEIAWTEEFVQYIKNSPKYLRSPIVDETIRDVFLQELAKSQDEKKAKERAKKILHNISAFYLGDPDYAKALTNLSIACASQDETTLRKTCMDILSMHDSTKERTPFLDQIYEKIFSITGRPETIFDLACGIHPLSIPWMGLNRECKYYAFDININRVKFINSFLELINFAPLAQSKDILVSPPAFSSDVSFIFKEVHRFEQRRKGCSSQLIRSIKSKYVIVSFPTISLNARYNLENSYRNLFQKIILDSAWNVIDFVVGNELFFCIEKRGM
jgi:16S rRNA (guanine(1405)-N(7))-methyltransferase